MKDWKIYREKLEELKAGLEKELSGLYVEYELREPDEHTRVPYILLRYYTDEEHTHERKVELFEYYLTAPVEETIKLIKDMVEEFLMEIDQSEYGGG